MNSIRNLLVALSVSEIFNSKSTFYFLLAAFIILLIAAENLIKSTLVPM
jgi:hypothetical protein